MSVLILFGAILFALLIVLYAKITPFTDDLKLRNLFFRNLILQFSIILLLVFLDGFVRLGLVILLVIILVVDNLSFWKKERFLLRH